MVILKTRYNNSMSRTLTKKDIIGKTIQEVISEYNLKIKLGAKSGSCFIYCGYTDEVDGDILDTAILDMYKRSLTYAEKTIRVLSAKPKTYKAFVDEVKESKEKALRSKKKKGPLTSEERSEIEKQFDVSRDAFDKYLRATQNSLNKAKDKKRELNRKISSYTTIKNNKIVDCYKSIDEPNTIILIYEGKDRGFAWTTEEFRKGEIQEPEE